MADLISRAAAIEHMKAMADCAKCDNFNYVRCRACSWDDAMNIVEELPAVDAVPVVRCSECKYAHMTYDGECKYCDFWQEDGGDALYLDKGFYCAAGEHRDGDMNG